MRVLLEIDTEDDRYLVESWLLAMSRAEIAAVERAEIQDELLDFWKRIIAAEWHARLNDPISPPPKESHA